MKPNASAGPHKQTRYSSLSMACLLLAISSASTGEASDTRVTYPSPTSLALEKLDGERYEQALHAGHLRIVSFWTTWCPPCLREMPSLERLGRDLQSDGVTVLAVNVGEPRNRVQRFRRLPAEPVVVLLDRDGENARQWQVAVYPTTFVVDADDRVVMQLTGAVDWDDAELRKTLTEFLRPAI